MLVSSNFFASAVSLFGHERAQALLLRAGQVGDGEAAGAAAGVGVHTLKGVLG